MRDRLPQEFKDRAPHNEGRDAVVEVERLVKRYGPHVAVMGVSFRVQAGRLFGLLGPNGAGKTSTVGCLTGLLDPTEGVVRLFGIPLGPGAADVKRRIGVMPERLALFDQLYAGEFLLFNSRMFGLDETTARSRIADLIRVLDLPSGRTRLAEFSTGMRKKVAFAAAVLHRPEVLFLDEPFEGLDPASVAMLSGWLRDFVAQGRTVVLTSHVLERVERICDEAAIMNGGRIVWSGSLDDLREGRGIVAQDRRFGSLEDLYLHLVGAQEGRLEWL